MKKENSKNRIYLIITMLMSIFAVSFIALMGYLNYKTMVTDLKSQVIKRIEADTVDGVETALEFGKRIDNFYGIDDVFATFKTQVEGTIPFVLTADGRLLYVDSSYTEVENDRISRFLTSSEFKKANSEGLGEEANVITMGRTRGILYPIVQDEEIAGYFSCIYADSDFKGELNNIRDKIILQTVISAVIVCLAVFAVFMLFKSDMWEKKGMQKPSKHIENLAMVVVMALGIITLSTINIVSFREDYKERIGSSTRVSLQNLENTIRRLSDEGVNIRNIDGLEEYIQTRVESLETLHVVRISEHIAEIQRTEEDSDIISYEFDAGIEDGEEKFLYLEAEVSSAAMRKQIQSIVLTLISTLIILIMFVFESTNLIELVTTDSSKEQDGFSEKKVSLSLRLTGFLCSTAEYMCVPYAAMMIRESGETLFGLSNGVTAALPLTLEGFTQMIAMLLLPKFVKKKDVRSTLIVSGIMMMLCNICAFSTNRAMVIIICRALAGIAYAGFKQISNYLITRGYKTDEGRSNNISQDNAGLLAGATCGAGLGAILSANLGYSMNFLIAAGIFFVYLAVTFFATPWKMLKNRSHMDEEAKPVSAAGIKRMIFSKEMLFFIILIGIPLNIGVMLCVTLIPAICQTNNISAVMLSYCYIANGIAGIYIGPALVAKAKKRFGVTISIAFAFALTAIAIFILHVPPIIVMIVISSMVLGFLDGFGTPMETDKFMSLKVVRNEVDESTALIFSVVLSYILLTFAPVIAELMLIPGKGFFTPMMIGVLVYAVAAVILALTRLRKGKGGDTINE